MKKRTWILAATIAALHAANVWSSFHGPDWLTCVLTSLWVIAILAFIVNLFACRGHWTFRVVALAISAAYVAWLAWELWQFTTQSD